MIYIYLPTKIHTTQDLLTSASSPFTSVLSTILDLAKFMNHNILRIYMTLHYFFA